MRLEPEVVVEKRMMGPKPEKTTFCSKRSAFGGSGTVGEEGAGGVGAAGFEYLSSSGCSSLGNAAKSGELCRDEPAKEGNYWDHLTLTHQHQGEALARK